MSERYDDFVRRATADATDRDGRLPYPYQRTLGEGGLTELLAVPTGCGKTMAVVLAWLYRALVHPDLTVRAATARRLVYVLPMRVLAEQTVAEVRRWLENLGLADRVGCHLLLGGEPLNSPWRKHPDQHMIIVGTLDMILSRALNRGYGESRYAFPIDLGLFSSDCHFVYDEVQLMGPALPTSRQLHGLREALGTAIPCSSTWMSATVPRDQMLTVDAPSIGSVVELGDDDRAHPVLARRLDAVKTVERLEVDDPKKHPVTVADYVRAGHRPGTLTLVVCNTVERARRVHREVIERWSTDAEVVLLHSRFRPPDRRKVAEQALAPVDPSGPGRIVVSTQVVESGVDVSAALLVTEAAPWSSIVQRAGRCNRDGLQADARLVWVEPPRPEPYSEPDVTASVAALVELDGHQVTPATLGAIDVPVAEEIHPTLRRKDLIDLFDTTPDLTGNDLDVSRFIRASDDVDVAVAWRELPDAGPGKEIGLPGRNERCPVPIGEIRRLLRERKLQAWQWDHVDGRWEVCGERDVRPGMVLLLDARSGGYDKDVGWSTDLSEPVPPIVEPEPDDDVALDDDPLSVTDGGWVTLQQHLADTRYEAAALLERLEPTGLTGSLRSAVVEAARLHDLGKAHPHFQRALRALAPADGDAAPDGALLAKSGVRGRLDHRERPHFRHELASALMLLGEGRSAITGTDEHDLVTYLVAAHHGRVRLAVRSAPDEIDREPPRPVLGILDGDVVEAVAVDGTELPALTLNLADMDDTGDGRTWTARVLDLRDRPDVGVFRLAFMEAIVRLADWRASASSPALAERPADA